MAEDVMVPEPIKEADCHGYPVVLSCGQRVVCVPIEGYLSLLRHLVADGYLMCADLCAVDYLTHAGRVLPEGIQAERFEVVLNLINLDGRERLRVRVQVPESLPELPSAFDVWPGCEAMEREVFDMFGIHFSGHPDLTRILMPEDWQGHPLRKDYDQGRIPVQFKETR
jgi:NADH-quinone oxidoreductase subunit C